MRLILCCLLLCCSAWLSALESEGIFNIVKNHCFQCHNDAQKKGSLNLKKHFYADRIDVPKSLVEDLYFNLEEEQMPPRKAKKVLKENDRTVLLQWLETYQQKAVDSNESDPGLVVSPRLNHIEYDRVIEDLIGYPVNAAKYFPKDGGAGSGFSNDGSTLSVNVVMLEYWLVAAKHVLQYARATPERGLRWFPAPKPDAKKPQAMLLDIRSDWSEWHDQQEALQSVFVRHAFSQTTIPTHVDTSVFADYFEAAWVFLHKDTLGLSDKTIDDIAIEHKNLKLMPSVLESFYEMLTKNGASFNGDEDKFYQELSSKWQALPGPQTPRAQIQALCQDLNKWCISPRLKDKRFDDRSRDDFNGNGYNPFYPFKGMDMDLLAKRSEQGLRSESDWRRPFYLNAPSMRRNVLPEDLEKLKLLIKETQHILKPNLAADRAKGIDIIRAFTQRAWRRPVHKQELHRLMALYDQQRLKGNTFDAGIKQALTAVLVSPHFLYRFRKNSQDGDLQLLTGTEMANRLSFALWASLPDEELLIFGKYNALNEEAVLVKQVRRMAKDQRIVTMGKQFAAQWLDFQDFSQTAQVDAQRFPDFNQTIAMDMENEAIWFFQDLFQNNESILSITKPKQRRMTERLAFYYGIIAKPKAPQWDKVKRYATGEHYVGALSLGAIQVHLSHPLRTSPTKRGAWLYRHLLGYTLPDPPDDIPAISEDEIDDKGLSLAQQMELHQSQPNCATCHKKIDPFGLALENFGPDGRWRVKNAQGQLLNNKGVDETGERIEGYAGLITYLNHHVRQEMLVNQFCKKLLAYMLGRSLDYGDTSLVTAMMQAMKENDYRVVTALEVVVKSKQFRYKRMKAAQ